MRSLARPDDTNDEETPLLQAQGNDALHKPTPLPTGQITILVLPWIAETIVYHSISPYINQLVRDLPVVGGDARKVGYYTGMISSLHFAAEAVTAFYWNRLSDRIGRRPVLSICLAGTTISMILFGLSRSFWAILFSRCLHGAMKGEIDVVKSMMAELVDEANMARGFSILMLTWSLGYVIGPLIGGNLARPQDRWPHLFSHSFWAKYPYFLPCLVVAAYCVASFVIMALFLKETVIHQPPLSVRVNSDIPQEESRVSGEAPVKDAQKPSQLRSLLTRPVRMTIINHAMLAFLEISALVLIPLIWSTPVEFGGLNFRPVSIGSWMSAYGCMNGLFQFAVFPHVIGRFGLRPVLVVSIAVYAAIFAMFPLENLALRHAVGSSNPTIWPLILLQLGLLSVHKMGFGAVFVYISSATPNKHSLGTLNGLAQTVASVQRTFGPAAADSLFAFSVTNNILGGNLVYFVLLAVVCIGLWVAAKLPKHVWTHNGR